MFTGYVPVVPIPPPLIKVPICVPGNTPGIVEDVVEMKEFAVILPLLTEDTVNTFPEMDPTNVTAGEREL
jgi:hypothetical protein